MTLYIFLFAFLAGAMILAIVVADRTMRKRDIQQMKTLVSGKGMKGAKRASDSPSLIKTEVVSPRERMAQLFLGKNLNQKLRDYIEQAGLDWDPARTMFLALILGVLGFNFFWYFVPRGQPISIVGVVLGAGLPFFIIYQKRAKRLRAFEDQFPDALEFVARAMRTGHAFTVALEMLHKEFGPPLRTEFKRTFDEQNLGLPMDVALERLGTRVPLLDVRFFVSAVLLQKRTGGNLAGLLDNLAYLIRERFKLRGKIRSISAHGRISGLVLSMIPVSVAVMMFWTNPDYILFFLDDPDGRIMLAITICLEFLGFVSIRKITDIGI